MARRAPAASEPLDRYRAKRNFGRTPEPPGAAAAPSAALAYVIQKHWASRLHYDLRLELDGVLLSWAVPKGPSFDPREKRMAVHVEDHPVDYGGFEGRIPPKQYGAGTVIVWDRGTWEPQGDPRRGLADGKLVFRLHGEKLAGLWELVRIAKPGDRQDPWILFKKKDAWARPLDEYDVLAALPDSVVAHPLGPAEQRQPAAAPPPASDDPAQLPGAVAAPLPARLAPQLAVAAAEVPTRGQWIYEIKLDGYRLLTRIDGARVTCHTRHGHDWTDRLGPIAKAVGRLGLASGWLDGEIVVFDGDGLPSFNALQSAFDAKRVGAIVYFVFDLPYCDGVDLRAVPLSARRELLRRRLEAHPDDRLRFSADFEADPGALLATARAMKLEGLIAKRADAPYVSERSTSWRKLKCRLRQEFVIGGYALRAGSRTEVGSLCLGVYDGGVLRHAGNVGTGWDALAATALARRLAPLERRGSPFTQDDAAAPGRWSKREAATIRFVEPELVAEIAFAHWTDEGHVRQATFLGLREDRPPRSVRREAAPPVAEAAPAPPPRAAAGRVRQVKVTHPERVIDASTGLTKLDLVRYYESIAERMLPHLKGRPVSLVRGPEGIGGPLFFQKHDDKLSIPGIVELDASLWPGHAALLEIANADALVAAAQMNVIEFHTWNATKKHIDRPDRVVFDIDPGEGVKWPKVQEAATLVRTILEELGLRSWLKTSGGKGLHVVVPLAPKHDTDTVKEFSRAVVQHLAETLPSRFVAKSGPQNRVGRIFVDYLRNTHGATTAAAFSARARPGLGVSIPVAWDELGGLKGGAQWSIANARDRLSFLADDPWAGYARARQSLTAAAKALGLALPKARRSSA